MHRLAVLLALLFTSLAAHAVGADFFADWRTADTTHFRLHYHAKTRAQAQLAARIAERVYPRITQQLQWEPRGRTEIVLFNEFDLPNGYSTPLPFNSSGIFLAVPDDGELLDNSAWLELVIAHEFTHTVHLDKVRGAPRVLQWIFGRNPYFFPNIFQPLWALEGVAVLNEGDASAGRGRLGGPFFEAYMRIERAQGLKSLAELNSNGRALPLSKEYLYGAYFFEFLARKYGANAITQYVQNYSGSPPFWPRVHTNPYSVTGKTMDALWDEFLVDLGSRVDARIEQMARTPRRDGEVLVPATWDVHALAAAPDGTVLAVLDDGITQPQLVRIDAQGRRKKIARTERSVNIDVRGDGTVLMARPEICGNFNLFFDLYEYTEANGRRRLTTCGRYRRGVWAGAAGNTIVAIQNDGGHHAIVELARDGRALRTLVAAGDAMQPIDVAVSSDARRLAFIDNAGAGRWRVFELDLTAASPKPTLLFARSTPMHGLRYAGAGAALEFLAVEDAVFNLWRWSAASRFERLTHTPTTVVLHSGVGSDGARVVGVLAAGGIELRRMTGTAGASSITRAAVAASATAAPASSTAAAAPAASPADAELRDERGYRAWRSLYPRSWFPVGFTDRGLTAIGATTFGADTLQWHQYAVTAMWETSQEELIGAIEYGFLDSHFISLVRDLKATRSIGADEDEETLEYERRTRAQWVSTLPWLRLERRLRLGIGAAIDRTDLVNVAGPTATPEDIRLGALLFDYDTRRANWLSEGTNQGYRVGLLYETYRPFSSRAENRFDGHVTRFDGQIFLPLGRTALGLNYIEAKASGPTEPYQLGGALSHLPLLAPRLNDREINLRGYSGDDPELRGRNARAATIEWRTPIADIDRHAMVPAVGINRLSAAAFFDIGGAWESGGKPDKYYRGVGVEALAEVRLLYALLLPIRVGVAHGLDDPGETRVYVQIGRSF